MLLAQCPVCQECFTNALQCHISALPCGHVFHQICIDTWFKTSSTCPQCRIGIRRTFVISRLYFDMVSYGPDEHPVIDTTSEETDTNIEVPQSSDNNSVKSLSVQLHRLRSENMRLDLLCKNLSQKSEENTKLISARDKEISTLSTLYSETDKLYEKERQRCRDLRTEISSLKQFLREAETMKAEAIQLRKETEDMQNVKKLISSSEDAARELFSRYTSKFENSNETLSRSHKDSELFSLCKWASVLRSELTATREKVRSYRTELSRVRKLQISASQKVARAESNAAEMIEQIHSTNTSPATTTTCNAKNMKNNQFVLDTTQNQTTSRMSASIFSHPSTSTVSPTCSTGLYDSLLVTPPVKLANKELTTPDFLLLSPLEQSVAVSSKTDFVTPGNPFRVERKQSISPPKQSISTSQTYSRTLLFSPKTDVIDKNTCKSSVINQRRPSSFYQMSIMRQHSKIANKYTIPNYTNKSFGNLHFPKPFDKTTVKSSGPSENRTENSNSSSSSVGIKRVVRNLKRSVSDTTKTSKLDNFVMKL
ncbi:unnamed protein product [Heterobilharzia americana]|nr:unnamed protein product [Heterobilharzia americana]